MIRIPDPGRFELRLMDGSANPYLLQAGVIAAGLDGINNKSDPGEALTCNMYTDYKNYPNLNKLPNEIEDEMPAHFLILAFVCLVVFDRSSPIWGSMLGGGYPRSHLGIPKGARTRVLI